MHCVDILRFRCCHSCLIFYCMFVSFSTANFLINKLHLRLVAMIFEFHQLQKLLTYAKQLMWFRLYWGCAALRPLWFVCVCVMPNSHLPPDTTRRSCLRRVCCAVVNWTIALNVFGLQMFCRRQSWVVANTIYIAESDTTETRQFCRVRRGGVN